MSEMDLSGVIMDSLFPEVDEKATVQNVSKFLARTFPKMVRVSGQTLTELRSPNYDGMPKGQSVPDPDARLVRRLYAEQVVRRSIEAMNHCDRDCQRILDLLYLQKYSDTMCYMAIGYSESSYFHDWKPRALLQFADCYLLEDLHIFKKVQ